MRILLILLIFAPTLAIAQRPDTFMLGGTRWLQRMEEAPNAAGPSFLQAQWVRSGRAGEEPVLAFTVREQVEGAKGLSWRLGASEIRNDTLYVYTLWGHRGSDAECRKGAMQEVYVAGSAARGGLRRVAALIYLEEGRPGEGREYLHRSPKGAEERAAFTAYAQGVMAAYRAEFVFGPRADALMREVRARITPPR